MLTLGLFAPLSSRGHKCPSRGCGWHGSGSRLAERPAQEDPPAAKVMWRSASCSDPPRRPFHSASLRCMTIPPDSSVRAARCALLTASNTAPPRSTHRPAPSRRARPLLADLADYFPAAKCACVIACVRRGFWLYKFERRVQEITVGITVMSSRTVFFRKIGDFGCVSVALRQRSGARFRDSSG